MGFLCPTCFCPGVTRRSDGRLECRRTLAGMVPASAGYPYEIPAFVGCGGIFGESEARSAFELKQRRDIEERRRISERQNAETRHRDALKALTQATAPNEIAVAMRQMIAGRDLVTGAPWGSQWHEWANACREAWARLLLADAVCAPHADIVCLQLRKNPLLPARVVELWRKPAWLHEIDGDAAYWLDNEGAMWRAPDVCPGRSWESPAKPIEKIFHAARGGQLGSATVERVRGGPPRRWDWRVDRASEIEPYKEGGSRAIVLAEILLSLIDDPDSGNAPAISVIADATHVLCPGCGEQVRAARRCRHCATELG